MKLAPNTTAFGRHETFPLRYAWLTKGFRAAREHPGIFGDPDAAMVRLGVGRNMVNAIHYWLQATRLIHFNGNAAEPTALGQALLGEDADPYLEDQATLWILHWLIASNARLATGFFWFFNRFAMPRFKDAELLAGLADFATHDLKLKRAQSTLKSDASTLLRMYAPAFTAKDKRSLKHEEGHLDTLMSQLRLIEQIGATREYQSPRAARPDLPPVALQFALAELFTELKEPAIPVRDLLYSDEIHAAPGAVFRLNEEGLMAALQKVMLYWPGQYELRDTAGIHQLYLVADATAPLEILDRHYGALAA